MPRPRPVPSPIFVVDEDDVVGGDRADGPGGVVDKDKEEVVVDLVVLLSNEISAEVVEDITLGADDRDMKLATALVNAG